jgi:hypothetical protein
MAETACILAFAWGEVLKIMEDTCGKAGLEWLMLTK